ncbi:MAG: flagellar assembly protein FliW [Spirochaetes bacterium]|nr:flagellar assembly protein FliW [Spirochaetota bacterium]
MKLATKACGEIEVDERQKVVFPQGLFGFEKYKEFVVFDADEKPFYWLQSVDAEKIAFVLINPFFLRPDYELSISNEDLAEIGIYSPDKALVFSIVTIPKDGGNVTVNLQGPLVINRDTKTGRQAILNDERWKTKHDLLGELAGAGK